MKRITNQPQLEVITHQLRLQLHHRHYHHRHRVQLIAVTPPRIFLCNRNFPSPKSENRIQQPDLHHHHHVSTRRITKTLKCNYRLSPNNMYRVTTVSRQLLPWPHSHPCKHLQRIQPKSIASVVQIRMMTLWLVVRSRLVDYSGFTSHVLASRRLLRASGTVLNAKVKDNTPANKDHFYVLRDILQILDLPNTLWVFVVLLSYIIQLALWHFLSKVLLYKVKEWFIHHSSCFEVKHQHYYHVVTYNNKQTINK